MMAGTIELGDGTLWTAASWLFEWVLSTSAAQLGDDILSNHVKFTIEQNLGWLDLSELSPDTASQLRSFFGARLEDIANQKLPTSLPQRDRVLEVVSLLSALSRST